MEYYYEQGMGDLLEISDEHVIWKIKKEFDWDRYNLTCDWMIKMFEHRYKDLKVFCCGRSGRHVCVVEHVFGFMEQSMCGLIFRRVGILRARADVAMTCLVYNICRYTQIMRLTPVPIA